MKKFVVADYNIDYPNVSRYEINSEQFQINSTMIPSFHELPSTTKDKAILLLLKVCIMEHIESKYHTALATTYTSTTWTGSSSWSGGTTI